MRKMFKNGRHMLGKLAAATGTAAVVGLAMAGPANAATAGWPSHPSNVWTNGWANVRSCASTDCKVVFALYGPAYSPVYMLCWTDGQWADGNYWTNRWFYIYSPTAGRYGYINASLVYNQASSPHC